MHPAAASGQDKKNNCTSHNDAAFVAALSRNASSAVLAVLLGAAWAVFRVYNVHQQRQSRHETKSADRRSPANAPIATRGSHDKPTQRQARRESPQVIGSHKTVHVTLMQDCAFRAMSQLNSAEGRAFAGKKHRLCLVDPAGCALPGPRDLGTPRAPVASDQQQQQSDVSRWFGGTSLTDRLAQALAARNAMDVKEFAESMEFFHKVRSHLKSSAVIVDLCCGHGFTGLLFAVFLKGDEPFEPKFPVSPCFALCVDEANFACRAPAVALFPLNQSCCALLRAACLFSRSIGSVSCGSDKAAEFCRNIRRCCAGGALDTRKGHFRGSRPLHNA